MWKKTIKELPEEHVIVETKISDAKGERRHAKLMRDGNLWFLPDGSMYVYYVPTHWRYC